MTNLPVVEADVDGGKSLSISAFPNSQPGGRVSLHNARRTDDSHTKDVYNWLSPFITLSPSSDPQLLTDIVRISDWPVRHT